MYRYVLSYVDDLGRRASLQSYPTTFGLHEFLLHKRFDKYADALAYAREYTSRYEGLCISIIMDNVDVAFGGVYVFKDFSLFGGIEE